MNRQAINQALAKALAYKQCGKQAEAEQWTRRLVELLECEGILAGGAAYVPYANGWRAIEA